ncbi:MAG: hypothetical protein KDD15_00030 [Lewinella sp.]|nr:hypothetical protein [Lewinella sp.]
MSDEKNNIEEVSDEKKKNTAKVEGQGNLVLQEISGSTITINTGSSPEVIAQLKRFKNDIDDLGSLVEESIRILLKQNKEEDYKEKIPALLRMASFKFFWQLTDADGRFEHLGKYTAGDPPSFERLKKVSDHLLPVVQKEVDGEEVKVLDWVRDCGQKEKHVLMVGEAGTGKTVSMLCLWQERLENESSTTIPVYIPLNQYNHASAEVRKTFITDYIARQYLGARILENKVVKGLWDWLNESPDKKEPKLLLLLDGWNEITSDITPLLVNLQKEWVELADKGVQLMISTRIQANYKFAGALSVGIIQPLNEDRLKKYLKTEGLFTPGRKVTSRSISASSTQEQEDTLSDLLKNPLMLSLYAGVRESSQKIDHAETGSYLSRTTELIRHFVDLKLERFQDDNEQEPQKGVRGHFLINYLLPYIAYYMEQKELPEIGEKELEVVINRAFQRFDEPDFFRNFSFRRHIKTYRTYIRSLRIGILPLVEEIDRFEELMKDFTNEVYPVAGEGRILRFIHQSFQEFFAAKHVLNEINMALEEEVLPEILKEQILSPVLQLRLGELIGEHLNPAELHAQQVIDEDDYPHRKCLEKVLDLSRGIFDRDQLGYTVWNVLSIWKTLRGSFAGADLSNLHLSNFSFHGLNCRYEGPDGLKLESRWEKSGLSPKQFFPQGHNKTVTRVRVSPDGQYLATASEDHTIKIWSVATNEFIRSLESKYGHQETIYSIAFSPDSKRLVSAGADRKLIEWSLADGSCLNVIRGHTQTVRQVAYHPMGEKIISASEDGTLREWSSHTGKCLHIFNPAMNDSIDPIISICYTGQGKTILIGTKNGTIREYTEGQYQKNSVFDQQHVLAISLDPSGKKFIALSPMTTEAKQGWSVREWSLLTGKEIQTYHLNESIEFDPGVRYTDITYSPDGKYILAAGPDRIVYKWSIELTSSPDKKNLATQSFTGHSRRVTSIAYHPDGKQFYSASFDASVKINTIANEQIAYTFSPAIAPYNTIYRDPDSNIVYACSENGNIHQWSLDLFTPRLEKVIKNDLAAYGAASYKSDKGNWLVAGGHNGLIRIWDLKDQSIKRDFTEHEKRVTYLILHRQSGQVISADDDGNLLLWKLEEESKAHRFPIQKGQALSHMALSPDPDDLRFVTSLEKGKLIIWKADPEQLEPIIEKDHGDLVYAVDFNGRYLVSGGYKKGEIKEWDLETGMKTSLSWKAPDKGKITYITYSPDQRKVLVAVREPNCLYELPILEKNRDLDRSAQKIFTGHDDFILAAGYSRDGKYIYSVGQDAALKMWDVEKEECLWSRINIPELKVAGLDLSQVHWMEPLTDFEWEWLQLYGAIV